MSGGVGSRFPIPNNVRKIIQDIREITGKQHSDEDIYAVLKECCMDPNDTAQKLMYLDTFHEVKKRRDRKKEGLNSWASEDSRAKQSGYGKGRRGASNGHSSNFADGGGRNAATIRKENGVNHITDRGHAPSIQPTLQRTKNNGASQAARFSAVAPNGAANESNGSDHHGRSSAAHSFAGSVTTVTKINSAADDTNVNKQENSQPKADIAATSSLTRTFSSVTRVDHGKSISSAIQLSTSAPDINPYFLNPVSTPSIYRDSDVDGTINGEAVATESNHVNGEDAVAPEANDLPASESKSSGSNTPNNTNEVERNCLSDASEFSTSSRGVSFTTGSSSICGSQPPSVSTLELSNSDVCAQLSTDLRQHVTFPSHFQVPEALKTGLTFGSFDSVVSIKERSGNGTSDNNNTLPTVDSSPENDKTAKHSNHSASLNAEGDHHDYQHSSLYLIEKAPSSKGNAISSANLKTDEPKLEVLLAPEGHPFPTGTDEPKQEVLLVPEGPPFPTVQNAQNYGLNFMSPMLGTQQLPFEGAEPQAQGTSRLPNFVGVNSLAVSSPSPTPPLPGSIPVSPQPVSILRPPYPANFFPYGHFYPPFYVSPLHQYLSHNGFTQQPSAGNMYLPPAAAAAAGGVKFHLPQFKAGANTGNTAHIGIPSGSFMPPPVGYVPSTSANSGNPNGNEELAVSQLKENHTYTTVQPSEGSAVWIPAPGQDISSLQVNSLYNLMPQGQHLSFPPTQAGHGAYASIYQSGQTVASTSTLLQQSQAVAGSGDTVGLPSGAYQQPQQPQIGWNSNL